MQIICSQKFEPNYYKASLVMASFDQAHPTLVASAKYLLLPVDLLMVYEQLVVILVLVLVTVPMPGQYLYHCNPNANSL